MLRTAANGQPGDDGANNGDSSAAANTTAGDTTAVQQQPAPIVVWNPLELLSPQAKVWLLGLLCVSTFTTAILITAVRENQDYFMKAGDLEVSQVAAFILGFFFAFWYLAVQFEGVRAMLNGEEWHAGVRRIMSDEHFGYVAAGAEFTCYLFLFYFCDRTAAVARSKKKYDKDTFWFIWLILCAAAMCTLRRAKPDKPMPKSKEDAAEQGEAHDHLLDHQHQYPANPEDYHVKHLQRDQTEEWKGWMQIMFLWYHYFEAKPLYNAIRLYIAAYVWMTGFGNFSYYYIRKDFSMGRFFQMQWRLNFLVLWVCMILNNEYMLYYICMLHTTFTVIIYVGLGVMNHLNATTTGVTLKIVALTCFAFIIWDVPGVFDTVWAPLTWLVQYHDPYKTERPIMHEWNFRSHLDHYVWIVGMIMAYNHPRVDGWLQALDCLPKARSRMIKAAVVGVTLFLSYLYVVYIFNLPKKEYNKLHPYTAWIPIVLYVILRNIFTAFRQYHMHLFEWLGKVTLETYIAQFHIWMATTGVNGAPKRLLRVFPEGWPLMDFAVMSVVCIWVSFRLFHTTNALRPFVIPYKAPNEVLKRNAVLAALTMGLLYLYAMMVRAMVFRYNAVSSSASSSAGGGETVTPSG